MKEIKLEELSKAYLKKIGKKGGEARRDNSTLEERKKWGRKGGRPRKSVKSTN